MKRFLIFFCLFILNNCYFSNTQILNFPAALKKLRRKKLVDVNKIVSVKKIYKLKNGMVIDKYRDHYGYWYRVRRGDCLSRIAQKAGVRVKTLAKANRIKINAMLKYKAYLFIPVSESYLNKKAEKITFNLKCGDFMWPLYGRITSSFGLRQWGWRKKFHKGIDIAAPPGTKVVSVRKGEVTFAGRKGYYGYVVIIKHSKKFETRYAHLRKVIVKKGEEVEQGQIIGLVGKTGRSTGYHLHFEIRINNYPVDPKDYLPEKMDDLVKIYYSETSGKMP